MRTGNQIHSVFMICRLVVLVLLPVALPVTMAQQSQTASVAVTPAITSGQASTMASSSRDDDLYRIGPGDVIDITVSKNEILSRGAVRVNNEGMIQVPMLEADIPAACKTERELASEIRERYLKFMHNPHVYVSIREYNSQPVAVLGAVNAPGRFQFQRRVRLLELLTFVNGPSDRAGRTIQIIHTGSIMRCETPPDELADNVSGAFITYTLEDTLQGHDPANPFVQPGDIIRVTEAEQLYVIGNVKTALTIMLKEPVTLSQAIARAGGTLPDSKLDKVRILRQQSPGSMKKTEIIVNLKAINKRQQEDVPLQANDVVEVPGASGGTKFLKDLLRTVVPTVTNLPMRVIL